jgi:hypothetical protein
VTLRSPAKGIVYRSQSAREVPGNPVIGLVSARGPEDPRSTSDSFERAWGKWATLADLGLPADSPQP